MKSANVLTVERGDRVADMKASVDNGTDVPVASSSACSTSIIRATMVIELNAPPLSKGVSSPA